MTTGDQYEDTDPGTRDRSGTDGSNQGSEDPTAETSGDSPVSVTLDVLVVGAGIQGLAVLHELRDGGYSVGLVARGPLGEGQTLHMHGILNSAYPAPRRELRRALEEGWIPFTRDHGVDLYGQDAFYYVAPDEVVDRKTRIWTSRGPAAA
ncbi:hypothetical protein BRD00_12945 [Halobacteriales archaeon QS_8_69_26]|nr:MAG: hypothetical protein BRD00_12945 [Halobacteriales archaeon QS_8_69_26]